VRKAETLNKDEETRFFVLKNCFRLTKFYKRTIIWKIGLSLIEV